MTNPNPDSGDAGPGDDASPSDEAGPERFHIRGEHRPDDEDETSPLFSGVAEANQGATASSEAGLIAGSNDAPVLVAGVGYPLLSDLSFGTVVAHRVTDWDLPDVAVADLSHTPLAAYQTVSDGDFETILLVGAEKRGGELNDGTPSDDPGAIHEYGPDAVEIPGDRLTELVGQTAMGFNTLENVVIVTRAFGSFPEDTLVIAVEPEYDSWGMAVEEFSDPVQAALEPVLERVRDAIKAAGITDDTSIDVE